jgi:hypothetical protein
MSVANGSKSEYLEQAYKGIGIHVRYAHMFEESKFYICSIDCFVRVERVLIKRATQL